MYIQNYGIAKSDQTVRTPIAANTVPPTTPQISANLSRLQICFANASTTYKFYLAFGSRMVSSTDYSVVLNPGDYYEVYSTVDAVSVVASGISATDYLFVTEMV